MILSEEDIRALIRKKLQSEAFRLVTTGAGGRAMGSGDASKKNTAKNSGGKGEPKDEPVKSTEKFKEKGRVKIKNNDTGIEYPGLKYTAGSGQDMKTFIKHGKAVFKRIEDGPPTFGGKDPSFKRVGGDEEKDILARLSESLKSL